MFGSSPAGNVYMINEEDIEKIKDSNKLSEKATKALYLLKKAKILYLKDMNNKQIKKIANDDVNDYLYSLVCDYWELVDSCRKLLKIKKNPLAESVVLSWENKIFPLIKEVDNLIIKWNENHNTNLPTIEQRLNVSLREERNYGKIFNY